MEEERRTIDSEATAVSSLCLEPVYIHSIHQNSVHYARHKFQEIRQIIMLLKGRKSYNVLMEVIKMTSPELMLSYKALHGHYIAPGVLYVEEDKSAEVIALCL